MGANAVRRNCVEPRVKAEGKHDSSQRSPPSLYPYQIQFDRGVPVTMNVLTKVVSYKWCRPTNRDVDHLAVE